MWRHLVDAVWRLVPARPRSFHHGFAVATGATWGPCPLCGRPYGGHEVPLAGGHPDTIPDPFEPGSTLTICPRCARAGRGVPAPAEPKEHRRAR